MYNYSFKDNGNFFIKTPEVSSFSDIKTETKQTDDCVITHAVYPNGLDLNISILSSRLIISSNKKLIQKDDNSYEFED